MAGVVAMSLLPGVANAEDFATSVKRAVTRNCVAKTRGEFPWFDAYYDSDIDSWHMLGTSASDYWFLKCLRDAGYEVESPRPE